MISCGTKKSEVTKNSFEILISPQRFLPLDHGNSDLFRFLVKRPSNNLLLLDFAWTLGPQLILIV